MKRRLILAAALFFLLFPTLLFAQNEPATVEFYGAVQSANATALVINGQLIDISSAQINTSLVVGMVVHVWATTAPDGNLVAQQIDPVIPGIIPGLVEISGVIDQIDGSTLLVSGLRVSIAGAQVDFPLRVGTLVYLYAEQTTPNEWTARLVTGLKLGGPILLAETPEVGASPTPDIAPPAATLEVSPVQTAEVFAPIATQDVFAPVATEEILAPVATQEVFAPAATQEVIEDGEDFEIRGTLQAFTDADFVVDGRRYFIGGARIDGRLVVGAQVRLEIRVVNGQWVLEEIKVNGSGGDDSGGDNRGGNSGSDDKISPGSGHG